VARAVAIRTGFDVSTVTTGEQLAAMSDEQLAVTVATCRVFAEVQPLQKERIVRALQSVGHSVGLLGDGVNDSAALRIADVGISVDTAAQVAKESAAIVLMRKDLNVIVEGVRIGRRTFSNTLKYIRITISANFGNVLSMALASAFLPYLPLLAGQVLLLNFMSDIPSLTVAGDRVDPEDLAVARRWDLPETRRFMIVFGLVSTVFDITTFVVLRAVAHADAATFHSAWFIESALTAQSALLVLRTRRPVWRSRPSALMAAASLSVASLTVSIPYTPFAQDLGLVPLPARLLAMMLAVSGAYVVTNEVTKLAWRRWRTRTIAAASARP
jgi:Mg2+-importing ATPase